MCFIKVADSSITLFGEMSSIVARVLAAARKGGAAHAKLRAEIAVGGYDLMKGLRMVASPRHDAYVNRDAYAEALTKLRRRIGWPKTEIAAA